MKLKEYISEVFEAGFKGPLFGKYFEIFSNPTQKELEEVSKDNAVRFIADNTKKKVYFFTPYVLHSVVNHGLKLNTQPEEGLALWGVAKKEDGKWVVNKADTTLIQRDWKKFLSQDYSWLEKWVDISPVVEKAGNKQVKKNKKEVEKLKKTLEKMKKI